MDYSGFFSNLGTSDDGGSQYICSGRYANCYRVNIRGKWLFVKRLKDKYANNERCRQAFRKEQELGLLIDHPNIVRYQLVDDDISIVQDYIDGLSLDRFVESNPRYFHKRENRKRFVGELLSAVECLHAHQIIHLDLKPQNILITTQGCNVKLVDLGMAFHDTFTSTFGGTEGFSAPEVISGNGAPTFAADIYSVGRLMDMVGFRPQSIAKRCSREEATKRYQNVGAIRQAIIRHRQMNTALVTFFCIALVGIAFFLARSNEKGMESLPNVEENNVPQVVIEKASPKTEERENTEAIPMVEKKEEPTKPLVVDSIAIKRQRMIDDDKRYLATKNEVFELLKQAKTQIYAPLDKQLANPDYSNRNIYPDLKDIFIKCNSKLCEEEKRICKEHGISELTFGYYVRVWEVYNSKLDKVKEIADSKDTLLMKERRIQKMNEIRRNERYKKIEELRNAAKRTNTQHDTLASGFTTQ